jgi:hypothetical protein
LQDQLSAHEVALQSMRQLDAKIVASKIPFNRHCTSSAKDVETQLRDYAAILSYKRPQLEQEIEYKKLRGVTQAQINEIESFFRQVRYLLSHYVL